MAGKLTLTDEFNIDINLLYEQFIDLRKYGKHHPVMTDVKVVSDNSPKYIEYEIDEESLCDELISTNNLQCIHDETVTNKDQQTVNNETVTDKDQQSINSILQDQDQDFEQNFFPTKEPMF